MLRRRDEGDVRGEVARHRHREDQGRRDPEGTVEVGVGRDELEEGALWSRQQRALDAVQDLQGVDVEERLVVLDRPEAGGRGRARRRGGIFEADARLQYLAGLEHRRADATARGLRLGRRSAAAGRDGKVLEGERLRVERGLRCGTQE